MPTPLTNKAEILADLWMNYRDDEEFTDFVEYNDLGLPLAFALANGIVDNPSNRLEQQINETFELFLAALGIDEDEGFEDLDQMLAYGFEDFGE